MNYKRSSFATDPARVILQKLGFQPDRLPHIHALEHKAFPCTRRDVPFLCCSEQQTGYPKTCGVTCSVVLTQDFSFSRRKLVERWPSMECIFRCLYDEIRKTGECAGSSERFTLSEGSKFGLIVFQSCLKQGTCSRLGQSARQISETYEMLRTDFPAGWMGKSCINGRAFSPQARAH